MSLRGYWRTLSERTDQSPAIRITRLTTTARTGRRTKTSVKRMALASVVLGLRVRLVRGLHLVVDPDGGAAAKLEGPRAHDLGPGRDARQHGDLVAARRPQLHELLRDGLHRLATRSFAVGNDVDRVAVGRVADRRGRQHYDGRLLAGRHARLDEHPGTQLALRVRERRLHLHVAGRRVHHRVERGDPSDA